ncbi:Fc.00g011380.m01.CDS01 [Cosmosporella sp. VM-42]
MSTSTLTRTRQQPVSQSATSEEVRELSLHILTRPCDKVDALKLVADSIAQQRQFASRVLIFHPICLAALAGAISIVHVLAGISTDDYASMVMSYSGVVTAYFLTIRYFTSSYIQIAEEMNWNTWLKGPNDKDDIILGAQYGNEIIAALVMRLPKASKTGTIRAWTTKTRYRGRGLGGDMLREAVKLARERRGRECAIVIAEDHVNSSMPLHSTFNAPFKTRDERVAKALSKAVAEVDSPSN